MFLRSVIHCIDRPLPLPSILGRDVCVFRILYIWILRKSEAPLKRGSNRIQSHPIRAGPLTHSAEECVSVFLRFLLDHDLDVSKHSRIPRASTMNRAQNNYNSTMGVSTHISNSHREILHSALAPRKPGAVWGSQKKSSFGSFG